METYNNNLIYKTLMATGAILLVGVIGKFLKWAVSYASGATARATGNSPIPQASETLKDIHQKIVEKGQKAHKTIIIQNTQASALALINSESDKIDHFNRIPAKILNHIIECFKVENIDELKLRFIRFVKNGLELFNHTMEIISGDQRVTTSQDPLNYLETILSSEEPSYIKECLLNNSMFKLYCKTLYYFTRNYKTTSVEKFKNSSQHYFTSFISFINDTTFSSYNYHTKEEKAAIRSCLTEILFVEFLKERHIDFPSVVHFAVTSL